MNRVYSHTHGWKWRDNNFYQGSKMTDNGVKIAATNSMAKITGIEGEYDPEINKYQPPEEYSNWEEVGQKNNLGLNLNKNFLQIL